jgi:glucokinase
VTQGSSSTRVTTARTVEPMPSLRAGIDVGGTRTKLGLVDAQGRVVARAVAPTVLDDEAAFLTDLDRLLSDLTATSGHPRACLSALGLGVPGYTDPLHDEIALVWPGLRFMETPGFRRRLEARLAVRCVVENDARVVALGEAWYGAGIGCRRVLVLTLGTGLGFGFVCDGRFTDPASLAHMAGHLIIDPHGPLCWCGQRGCLERLVSSEGLCSAYSAGARLAATASGTSTGSALIPLTAQAVCSEAAAGNPVASAALSDLIVALAAGIDAYINLLVPDCIILAGGIAHGLAGSLSDLRGRIRARPVPSRSCTIVLSTLHEDAGILGAAHLVLADAEVQPGRRP